MKFLDNIYLLLSYTNSHDLKTKYPNLKTIITVNIIGLVFYFIIPTFLAKSIFSLLFIGINYCFKETRGIMITFTPIILWILLFSTAKDIPMSWRRPIDVTTLSTVEKKLGSISFHFYKNENTFLDLLAWIPYGIVHYIMPFLVGTYLVLFYKPGYASAYLFFFGVMNTVGVLTQLFWPTAPPWYYKSNGTEPADYTMHGDPAGLERIDKLFHVDFYTSAFTTNPVPWGAWPSLHSGFAVYSAFFLIYLFPKYSPIFLLYVAWIWWATMYLGHHYFFDLLGGLVYALVCAVCGIIYIVVKKPYHKDYVELKSIMIQDDDFEPSNFKINRSHNNNNMRKIDKTNSDHQDFSSIVSSNAINGSTINGSTVNGSTINGSTINESIDSNKNDTDTNNQVLIEPSNNILDQLSVIPDVDNEPSSNNEGENNQQQ